MISSRCLAVALFIPTFALADPPSVLPQEPPVLREIAGTVNAGLTASTAAAIT